MSTLVAPSRSSVRCPTMRSRSSPCTARPRPRPCSPASFHTQPALAQLLALLFLASAQVVNVEKPNIRTGLTCPVLDCTAVCDLVVMQARGAGRVGGLACCRRRAHVGAQHGTRAWRVAGVQMGKRGTLAAAPRENKVAVPPPPPPSLPALLAPSELFPLRPGVCDHRAAGRVEALGARVLGCGTAAAKVLPKCPEPSCPSCRNSPAALGFPVAEAPGGTSPRCHGPSCHAPTAPRGLRASGAARATSPGCRVRRQAAYRTATLHFTQQLLNNLNTLPACVPACLPAHPSACLLCLSTKAPPCDGPTASQSQVRLHPCRCRRARQGRRAGGGGRVLQRGAGPSKVVGRNDTQVWQRTGEQGGVGWETGAGRRRGGQREGEGVCGVKCVRRAARRRQNDRLLAMKWVQLQCWCCAGQEGQREEQSAGAAAHTPCSIKRGADAQKRNASLLRRRLGGSSAMYTCAPAAILGGRRGLRRAWG